MPKQGDTAKKGTRSNPRRTRTAPKRFGTESTGTGVTKRSRLAKPVRPRGNRPVRVRDPIPAGRLRAAATANQTLRRRYSGTLVSKKVGGAVVTAYRNAPTGRKQNSDLRDRTRRKEARGEALTLSDYTKTQLSEQMGEVGAVEFLRTTTRVADLPMRHADENNPFDGALAAGTPWAEVVTFRGPGVADVMYWDGTTLHVVEAKGGSSSLAESPLDSRTRIYDPETGERVHVRGQTEGVTTVAQGTMGYLVDIAWNMFHSGHEDNRSDAGDLLLTAIQDGTLRYLPVRTAVPDGSSTAHVSII